MHDFPFSQEAQWREHIGVIRQVDEIFIGAARFLLCCVGVSAKEKGRGIKGFPCLFEFCDYSVVGFPVLSESPPAVLPTVMLSPTLTHVSVSST